MLLEDLPERIEQKVRTGSERKAYLRADARAQHGDIEAVIQQVRLWDINHVVVVTEQRDLDYPFRSNCRGTTLRRRLWSGSE